MSAKHPKEQKALGRLVEGFNVEEWNNEAMDIVYQGNLAKFIQNPKLAKQLLSTQGIMVEASPYDRVWGIGYGLDSSELDNPNLWGENKLGLALLNVRIELSDYFEFNGENYEC